MRVFGFLCRGPFLGKAVATGSGFDAARTLGCHFEECPRFRLGVDETPIG